MVPEHIFNPNKWPTVPANEALPMRTLAATFQLRWRVSATDPPVLEQAWRDIITGEVVWRVIPSEVAADV